MSYPAKGRAARRAGAPLAGMRPQSESGSRRESSPCAPTGSDPQRRPLFRPPARPAESAGIDGKANAASRRPCDQYDNPDGSEAAT